MASSIRLTNSGAPDTPPAGYARLYLEDYNGQLYLKMKRPDGSVQVFGTVNAPIEVTGGGTGIQQIPQIGQLLIGTGDGYQLSELTAGNNINITNSAGSITLDVPDTSVGLNVPVEFEISNSPVINTGTLVITKKSQSPNTIYAGPTNGIENVPTFRLLTQADIPQLSKHKIIDFTEEVQDIVALTFEDSSSILLQYDDNANKLRAFLSDTGVIPGIYGSVTSVPSINVDSQGRIISVTSIPANFISEQITDIKEKIEDTVGELIQDTASINAEYNDVLSRLELHVKPEYLITTNISESENFRAPTSQAIKQYVDDLNDAERNARIAEDNLINQRLNIFLNDAPEVLDTIVEISGRFEAIEQALVTGAQIQSQNLASETSNRIAADTALDEKYEQEIERIDANIDVLESDINAEVDTRILEIERVYNAIQAHRERIDLTPTLLTQSIELEVEQLSHIMPNSVVAFVDRIGLFEELDFVLANGSNNKVVLNLTPEALTLLDGTEILRISYLTKI